MNLKATQVSTYTIPTDQPEADGTLAWDETMLVLVEVTAVSDETGLGYTYAHPVVANFIRQKLAPLLIDEPLFAIGKIWEKMVNAVRNVGRPGIAAHAISAVDTALWDLKARVLDLPLYQLLTAHRTAVPVYGSGAFTTYEDARLHSQFNGWLEEGITRFKIKIGEEWGHQEQEDIPLSAHTAPALHLHIGCAAPQISHLEYFHDHVRIEKLLFDGFPRLENGMVHPYPDRSGLGLTFKHRDAEPYQQER